MMRRLLYWVLFLASLALLFYWVKIPSVLRVLSHIQWFWFILSVVLGVVLNVLQGLRLKLMLRSVAKVSFWSIISSMYITTMLSILVPYSGGFAMSYYLAKKGKSSYAKILLILFVSFILVLLPNLLLGFLGILYFGERKRFFLDLHVHPFLLFFLITLLFLFCYILLRQRDRIFSLLRKLKDGFHVAVYKQSTLFAVLFLLILTIAVGFFQVYATFVAFDLHPPLLDLILAVNVLGLLHLIPGIPTKLGQEEAIGVLTLPYLLSLDKASVFTMIFVTHIISLMLAVVLGFVFVYFLRGDIYLVEVLRKVRRKK